MDTLAINLKAAKLCGLKTYTVTHFIDFGVATYDDEVGNERTFCIFTNPADREATVIALGEKHGIIIYYNQDYTCWMSSADDKHYSTYTEALAAAVEAA